MRFFRSFKNKVGPSTKSSKSPTAVSQNSLSAQEYTEGAKALREAHNFRNNSQLLDSHTRFLAKPDPFFPNHSSDLTLGNHYPKFHKSRRLESAPAVLAGQPRRNFDKWMITMMLDEMQKYGTSLITIHEDLILNLEMVEVNGSPKPVDLHDCEIFLSSKKAQSSFDLPEMKILDERDQQKEFFEEFFKQCDERNIACAFLFRQPTNKKEKERSERKQRYCKDLACFAVKKTRNANDAPQESDSTPFYPFLGNFGFEQASPDPKKTKNHLNLEESWNEIEKIQLLGDYLKHHPKHQETVGVYIWSNNMDCKFQTLARYGETNGVLPFKLCNHLQQREFGIFHDPLFYKEFLKTRAEERVKSRRPKEQPNTEAVSAQGVSLQAQTRAASSFEHY